MSSIRGVIDIMIFYTPKEVQNMLKIGNKKTYKLFNQPDFPSFKVDGTWRIESQEFSKYLANLSKNKCGSHKKL